MPHPGLVNPYSSAPGDRERRWGLPAALVGAGAAAAVAAGGGAAHADPDESGFGDVEFSGETIVTDDLFAGSEADTSGADLFTVDAVSGLGPVELSPDLLPAIAPDDQPEPLPTPELPAVPTLAETPLPSPELPPAAPPAAAEPPATLQISTETLTPFDPAHTPVPAAELTVTGTTTPEQTAALDTALGLTPDPPPAVATAPEPAPLPALPTETAPTDASAPPTATTPDAATTTPEPAPTTPADTATPDPAVPAANTALQISTETLTPFDPAHTPVSAADLTVTGTTTPEQTAALDTALGLTPEQPPTAATAPEPDPLPAPPTETAPTDAPAPPTTPDAPITTPEAAGTTSPTDATPTTGTTTASGTTPPEPSSTAAPATTPQISTETLTPFDPTHTPVSAAELTITGTTTPEQTAALDTALGLTPDRPDVSAEWIAAVGGEPQSAGSEAGTQPIEPGTSPADPEPDTSSASERDAPPREGDGAADPAPSAATPVTASATAPGGPAAATEQEEPDGPDGDEARTDQPAWVRAGVPEHALDENARQGWPESPIRAMQMREDVFLPEERAAYANGSLPARTPEERVVDRQKTGGRFGHDFWRMLPGADESVDQLAHLLQEHHGADGQDGQEFAAEYASPEAVEAYLCLLAVRCQGAPPEATIHAGAAVAKLLGSNGEMDPDAVEEVLAAARNGFDLLDQADEIAAQQLPDARLQTGLGPRITRAVEEINRIAPGFMADLMTARILPEAHPAGPDGTPRKGPVPGSPPEIGTLGLAVTPLLELQDGSITPADLASLEAACEAIAQTLCDLDYRIPGSTAGPTEPVSPERQADLRALQTALSDYWQQFRTEEPGSARTAEAWAEVETAKTRLIGSMRGTTEPTPTVPDQSAGQARGGEVAQLTSDAQTAVLDTLFRHLPSHTHEDGTTLTEHEFETRLLGRTRVAAQDHTFPLPDDGSPSSARRGDTSRADASGPTAAAGSGSRPDGPTVTMSAAESAPADEPGPDREGRPAPDASAEPQASGVPPWVEAGLPEGAFDENARQGWPEFPWLRAMEMNERVFAPPPPQPRAGGLLPPLTPEEAAREEAANRRHGERMDRQRMMYEVRRGLGELFPSGAEQSGGQIAELIDGHIAADVSGDRFAAVDSASPEAVEVYLCLLAVRCEGAPPEATIHAGAALANLLGSNGEIDPDAVEEVLAAARSGLDKLDRADDLAAAFLPDARLRTDLDPRTAEAIEEINRISPPGAMADLMAGRLLPDAHAALPDGTPLTNPLPGSPPEIGVLGLPGAMQPEQLRTLRTGTIPPAELAALEEKCQAIAQTLCDLNYRIPGSTAGANEPVGPERQADLRALETALGTYWRLFQSEEPGSEATTEAWTEVENAKTRLIGSMRGTTEPEPALPAGPAVPVERSPVADLTSEAQTEVLRALFDNLPSRTRADGTPLTERDFVAGVLGARRVAVGSHTFPLPPGDPAVEADGGRQDVSAGSGTTTGNAGSAPSGSAGSVPSGPAGAGDPAAPGQRTGAGNRGGGVVAPELPRPQDPIGDTIAGGRPSPPPPLPEQGPEPRDPRQFDPNDVPDSPPVEPDRRQESFPGRDEELERTLAPTGVPGLFTTPLGREESVSEGPSAGEETPTAERPGGTRVGSDGQRQVLVSSSVLLGDDRGTRGRVDVFQASDGSREAVVQSARTVNDTGIATVFVPRLSSDEVGSNLLGTVTSVQRLGPEDPGTVSGAPVDAVKVRVRTHTQVLAGTGGSGSKPGSVVYRPAPVPGQEIRTVTPSITTLPNGDRVVSALVPVNRFLNLDGRPESFQVDVDVPMTEQRYTIYAPLPASPALTDLAPIGTAYSGDRESPPATRPAPLPRGVPLGPPVPTAPARTERLGPPAPTAREREPGPVQRGLAWLQRLPADLWEAFQRADQASRDRIAAMPRTARYVGGWLGTGIGGDIEVETYDGRVGVYRDGRLLRGEGPPTLDPLQVQMLLRPTLPIPMPGGGGVPVPVLVR